MSASTAVIVLFRLAGSTKMADPDSRPFVVLVVKPLDRALLLRSLVAPSVDLAPLAPLVVPPVGKLTPSEEAAGRRNFVRVGTFRIGKIFKITKKGLNGRRTKRFT